MRTRSILDRGSTTPSRRNLCRRLQKLRCLASAMTTKLGNAPRRRRSTGLHELPCLLATQNAPVINKIDNYPLMSTNFVRQLKGKSKYQKKNTKIFSRLIESDFWRRISAVAFKRKSYYVLGAILTILCAIELILNQTHSKDTDDFFSIKMDEKFNLSAVLNSPKFYPWHEKQHFTVETRYFSSLWESSLLNEPESAMYLISNGRMYGRRGQHDKFKQEMPYHRLYLGRIREYEQLISFSLQVARQAVISSDQHQQVLDWRLRKLIEQPFPFYFIWGDFRTCRDNNFPFFAFPTFARHFGEENCFPLGIPTYAQWRKHKHKDYYSWDLIFKLQNQNYPWETKIGKAVWRGSTTGDAKNWRNLPRSKLVQYSLDHPSILDAAFVEIVQRNETEKEDIIASGFNESAIPFEDFQKYKAIIDIDGNSWSSRFGDLLCTNSVVIKVEPRWVDYFYSELQPWIHYVPVNGNMSNLVEILDIVMSEDRQTEMQQITQQANGWCQSKLNGAQMVTDMVWILIYYMELLTEEDAHSNLFTRWKKNFSSKGGWNSSDWEEILAN